MIRFIKSKKYSILLSIMLDAFVVPVLLTSCQDDSFREGQGLMGTSPVRMSAVDFSDGDINMDGPSTRVSLVPTFNGTKFFWNQGDVAAVYSSGKGLTNFFIDEESISDDGTSATFNGAGFSLDANSVYYAFYPYNSSALDKTKVPISFCGQSIHTNGSFSDLGKYDYMCSKGLTNTNGNVNFDFLHIGCVVEFQLKVQQTANYTQVRLELDGKSEQSLIKSGLINLQDESSSIYATNQTPADTILRVDLNEDNGIYVKKDSLLKVYMILAPQNLSNEKIIVRLLDSQSNWYSARVSGKNMKAGYTYHYAVNGNSENGGFTGHGKGLPDDFTFRLVSSFENPRKTAYEDLVVDGNIVYGTGLFGVQKIDFSDESSPKLLAEKKVFSDSYLKGRGIAQNKNCLFINYRQYTSGTTYHWLPQLMCDFEKGLPTTSDDNLSNNVLVNQFFKKISSARDLSKVYRIFLFKAFKRTDGYRNSIVLKLRGEDDICFTAKSYATREEALKALATTYKIFDSYCTVDWNSLPEGENDFQNITINYVRKTNLRKSGTSTININASYCPNSGIYSGLNAACLSADNGGSVIYENILSNNSSNGNVSMWLKIPQCDAKEINIPIFSDDGKNMIYLHTLLNASDFHLALGKDNMFSSKSINLKYDEWYNIKVSLDKDVIQLYYREKECQIWNLVGTLSNANHSTYNRVAFGLDNVSKKSCIYIDDFYFNEKNIDGVTYVNGKVSILKKTDLSVLSTMNLDYKGTGIAVFDNALIVNGLNSFNIYDVSNCKNPKLKYTYHPKKFKDIQGVNIFEVADRRYAFICCYSQGFMILDISDLDDISIVVEDDYSNLIYNGKSMKYIMNCFNAVVNYPYVYLTNSTVPHKQSLYPETSGVLTLDISDFKNIKKTLSFMPKGDITNFNTYGDPCPTRIFSYGNTLLVNNREKGLAVFDISKGCAEYEHLVNIENSSINSIFVKNDGTIFVGDDNAATKSPKVYLLKAE